MIYHGKDLKGLKFDYFAIQTLNCRYEETDGEAIHFLKPVTKHHSHGTYWGLGRLGGIKHWATLEACINGPGRA